MKKTLKKIVLWLSYFAHKKRRGSKIVYYHDVYDHTKYTDMGTPLELFRQHVEAIKRCGFSITDNITNDTGQVQICFDDGFRGVYDTRRFFADNHIRPTVFLAVEFIGREGYLTQGEIAELQEAGFIFQSHTWSHADLTSLDDEGLERELLRSKKKLSELTGKRVDGICFPRGLFSDKVIERSLEYGYEKLYSSLYGDYVMGRHPIARNLVQHASAAEVKYILLGDLTRLRNRLVRAHYKK